MIDAIALWSQIEARAQATPDAVFLLEDHDRALSFAAYRDRCERVAAGLAAQGVGLGDRVSWQLPTWIESAVLAGALARLGAVQNPILPIYRQRELAHILGEVGPKLLIVPRTWRGFDYAAMAEQLVAGSATRVLVCDRTLPEADPRTLPAVSPPSARDAIPTTDPAATPRPAESDLDPVRWILYASGTTSSAKGALHGDASIAAGARWVASSLAIDPADRFAIPFALTHISGIAMLMVCLMSGASAILIEQFDDATPARLGELGCTIATGGTPLVLRYLEAQRRDPKRPLFPKLKAAMAGAAPKPPQLHGEIRAELGGLGVVSCYGSTEVPFLSVSTVGDDDDRLARTEGRVDPAADARIVDGEGRVLPAGASGELRVRGPQVCRGYLDPKLAGEAFDADGYFRTGDLASLDAGGYLTITGRLKDVIIRKGENISAKEVEDVLYGHPAIAEIAVVGLPDA